MSSSESTDRPTRSAGFHDFDLAYYVDDRNSPSEVTITATESTGALATEWITADIEDAVSFESIP